MLKKPGAQNKAVCEKQSKQRELGNHWKSIKTFILKKTRGDAKRLTGILVLTKDWFYILQNQIWVFKKKKATLLVKPINYWELVKPINYRR